MAGETPVDRMELPRPDVTADEAAHILAEHYHLSGTLSELGSQQDRNYQLTSDSGRYVLKICHAAYETQELEAQIAALAHLRAIDGAPRVPSVVPTADGQEIVDVLVRDQTYKVRLLGYLEGESLKDAQRLPQAAISALGALCARLALALSDFNHPGLDRNLQWDLRRAGPVAVQLLSAITDGAARDRIAKAMVAAVRRIQPLAPHLRVQAVHHDVTADNVVGKVNEAGLLIPDGVIDFGDIISGWRAGDLAVTCAALLHQTGGNPFDMLPAIAAYHAIYPLEEVEAKALWPLIVARAVILVASSEQQLAVDPQNDYVLGNLAAERQIFDVATGMSFDLMEAAILQATGFAPAAPDTSSWSAIFPNLQNEIAFLDLSIDGPHFVDGNWREPDFDWRLLARTASETGAAATRYGEYRLSRAAPLSAGEPASFALHSDLCLPARTSIAAPFAGRISWNNQHLILNGDMLSLHLDGIETDLEGEAVVEAGQLLGAVSGEEGALGGLRLQLCQPDLADPPLFATSREAGAWTILCPSMKHLLGASAEAQQPDDAQSLALRQAHFAAPQKHYYATPPQIERGWREYLFDVKGRAYLDMVNNVTILGHGHPYIAEVAAAQWQKLNTNSRFHYGLVAEFSARLASLAPEGLDTVFLVNSGSEANDLALRLAWAHTGARNMLCLLEAYHGWSVASDAISTSIADNPRALETRPAWVHAIACPNTYRGEFRGENAAEAYLQAARSKLDLIELSGAGLAGFICEAVYGSAGGLRLPAGYLAGIYQEVRARGGLCIADEVQVGYGRLGDHFWGFEEQGVRPDIITLAKCMGNGHPLGAVITTKEIAASLEREGYFFSSSGGSPVSCAVGMAVLDVMQADNLQENARQIGAHLRSRLEALAEKHPLLGAVHGMGLYLGAEFVRDAETLEPATHETALICERLLELGVIMQPTGDHLNILKIKPPLCISRDSADFFIDMLDMTLLELA
ncbi:aminotransferase [Oryzifoliimicrobium ureilyticus]|uniref:aminotransferase n=1 Tax=Oryzifoliimicrobium ureilyticus TaxID=3113724 RepID=UPI0030760B2D